MFIDKKLPGFYEGMSYPELYRELGCSNRIYDYNTCFKKIDDPGVRRYSRQISLSETEHIIETPVGKLTFVKSKTSSSYATMIKKWMITSEEDMKIAAWIEERCEWVWDQEAFDRIYEKWGDIGLPTMYMPRVNVQHAPRKTAIKAALKDKHPLREKE